MSAGQIAGLVIGIAACLTVAAVIAYFSWRAKRSGTRQWAGYRSEGNRARESVDSVFIAKSNAWPPMKEVGV